MGPWGEVSKDLHSLVKVLAESKLAAKARSLGREISDRELGIITTQIRKYLSTAFVQAQSLCLLNRLCFLGEGSKAAAGRRDLARRLEVGRKRERQAHYQAHIRGRGLSRVGNITITDQTTVRLNLKTECCPKTFQGVHLLHFLLLAIFINFSCSYIIVMRSKLSRNCRLYIYIDVTC